MSADEIICQHCGIATSGEVYRVTSEEDGVVFLNMIVCRGCSNEARRLGLKTAEVDRVSREELKKA